MLLQNIITGLLVGSVYGLIACGLSLLFGVMKIVNFAHGAVLMVGMYVTFLVHTLMGLDPYLSIIIVVPVLFGFGYLAGMLVEPVLMREKSTGPISVLLLTLGLSLFLINGALLIFGSDYKVVPSFISGQTWAVGDLIINLPRLFAAGFALVSFFALHLLLVKTDLGKSMRATSQDMEAARLMGIDERKICRIGFGVSAATTGVAAAVLVPFYYVNPVVGDVFQLKAFIVVVLGGIGTINGSFLGGWIVGLVEAIGAQYLNLTYAQMLVFVVFILILLLRPSGLIGTEKE